MYIGYWILLLLYIYELLVYLSGVFSHVYCILVYYYELYPTKYFSPNLSHKVVSKFDQYHTLFMSKNSII